LTTQSTNGLIHYVKTLKNQKIRFQFFIMKKHNFMTRRLEEKEILEDKDLMNQIRASEKNIKAGKIKEFKY